MTEMTTSQVKKLGGSCEGCGTLPFTMHKEGCPRLSGQGSLPAASRPSVPTEGVTASGDDLDRRWADQVHTTRCWGRTSYSDEMLHCYCDQPVENSPIPALGGTEAEGRSAPKDPCQSHKAAGIFNDPCCPACPTPVRGLEPVAWHLTHREEPEAVELASAACEPITLDDRAAGWKAAPLYSASDVSALQGEVERLREALKPFAEHYERNDCADRAADDALEVPIYDLRRARQALEPNQ